MAKSLRIGILNILEKCPLRGLGSGAQERWAPWRRADMGLSPHVPIVTEHLGKWLPAHLEQQEPGFWVGGQKTKKLLKTKICPKDRISLGP